jgi:hypothetical protein
VKVIIMWKRIKRSFVAAVGSLAAVGAGRVLAWAFGLSESIGTLLVTIVVGICVVRLNCAKDSSMRRPLIANRSPVIQLTTLASIL